jgi:hypothetical protein
MVEGRFSDQHADVRRWAYLTASKLGGESALAGLKKENPSPEMLEVAEILAGKKESLSAWNGDLTEERLQLLMLLGTDDARAMLTSLPVPADKPELAELRIIALRNW